MTPREYVEKYRLDKTIRFNHDAFVDDLAIDFRKLVETHKAGGSWGPGKFLVVVKDIRRKYEAVFNTTRSHFSASMIAGLWSYFYAVVVSKERPNEGGRGEGKRTRTPGPRS